MPRPAAALTALVVSTIALPSPVWVPGPTAPAALTPREGSSMAYDAARDRVVLFGGFDWTTGALSDTWEYDGAAWAEVAVSGPAPRIFAAMTYDATRSVMVMFGGSNGASGFLGDAWECDGSDWGQAATPPAATSMRTASPRSRAPPAPAQACRRALSPSTTTAPRLRPLRASTSSRTPEHPMAAGRASAT